MSVPAAKVKSICTAAEVALVRASRQPALGKLSLAETKQHAQRARTLADKWEGLRRSQVRTKSRVAGGADSPANTKLKAEIFRDALDSFNSRMAQLESAGAPRGKRAKATPKSKRTVKHRAARAEVRQQLSSKEALLNAPRRKKKAKKASRTAKAPSASEPAVIQTPVKKKRAKKKTAKAGAGAVAAPTKKKAKKKTAKKMTMLEGATGPVTLTPGKQRQAKTAAKQRRVAASGLTSRVRGHVSARGRRNQAARDGRN